MRSEVNQFKKWTCMMMRSTRSELGANHRDFPFGRCLPFLRQQQQQRRHLKRGLSLPSCNGTSFAVPEELAMAASSWIKAHVSLPSSGPVLIPFSNLHQAWEPRRMPHQKVCLSYRQDSGRFHFRPKIRPSQGAPHRYNGSRYPSEGISLCI